MISRSELTPARCELLEGSAWSRGEALFACLTSPTAPDLACVADGGPGSCPTPASAIRRVTTNAVSRSSVWLSLNARLGCVHTSSRKAQNVYPRRRNQRSTARGITVMPTRS